MYKKAVETGNSRHRGPRWGTWKGFIYWDFLRDRWRRALETEYNSLWEQMTGIWRKGSFTGDLEGYAK